MGDVLFLLVSCFVITWLGLLTKFYLNLKKDLEYFKDSQSIVLFNATRDGNLAYAQTSSLTGRFNEIDSKHLTMSLKFSDIKYSVEKLTKEMEKNKLSESKITISNSKSEL